MKRGTVVKLIQPVLQGKILKVMWDEEANCRSILVEFETKDGTGRRKWVLDKKLEEVTDEA